ncbi:hypothetical protein C0J52_08201 [Blattella germanica]|nr:hypothetical protein C0J52_08201 [Blattella germanica]
MFRESDLKECKILRSKSYVCKQKQPLLSTHLNINCIVKLLQPITNILENSEKRVISIPTTLWIQLDNNKWLYFDPQIESVTILCKGDEPIDTIVKGVGKFRMNSGCKGFSKNMVLMTEEILVDKNSTEGGDLLSQPNLIYDCCEELRN